MAGKNRYTLDLTDGSKLVFDVRPGASMREIKTEADKALDKKNAEDERAFYKKSGDQWASGVSGAVAGESRKAKAPVEVPKFKPAKSVLSFARPTLEDRFPTKQWKPNLDDTRTELLPKPVLEKSAGERLLDRQDEAGVYHQPGPTSRIFQHYLGWQMDDEAAGVGNALSKALTLQDPIAGYEAGKQAEEIRLDRAWDEAGPSGIYPAIAGSFLSGGFIKNPLGLFNNARKFSGLAPEMIEGGRLATAIPRAAPTSLKPLLGAAAKQGGTVSALHGYGSGEGLQDSLYEAAGQGLTGAVVTPPIAAAIHGVANAPIVRAIAADKRGAVVMPWHATPDELGRLNNIALKMHQQKASPAEISIASGGWHLDPFSKQWVLELPDTGLALDTDKLSKMAPGEMLPWREVADFGELTNRLGSFELPGTGQGMRIGPLFDPEDPAGRYYRNQHAAQINLNSGDPLGYALHEVGGHAYANATGMLGGSNTQTAPQVFRGRYFDPFMADLQPQFDYLEQQGYSLQEGQGNPPAVEDWLNNVATSIEDMARYEGYARGPGENMAEALRGRRGMPADTRLVTPLQNSMPYPFSQQLNPAGGFGLTGSSDPMQPGEYNKPLPTYTQPLIKNIGLTPPATKGGPLTSEMAANLPALPGGKTVQGEVVPTIGSLADFTAAAGRGKVHQARSDMESLQSMLEPNSTVRAQSFDMNSPIFDLPEDELDRLTEGLVYEEGPRDTLIIARSQDDANRLADADNATAYGQSYGYSDDDIAAFYLKRRYGDAARAYQDWLDDGGQPTALAGDGAKQLPGPSSLTPEQTMIDPTEEADQASSNFDKWFGDSKVVDEEGKPLTVYHGSQTRGLDQFDTTRSTTRSAAGDTPGTYFTADPMAASGYTRPPISQRVPGQKTPPGQVYAANLSLQNPLDTTDDIARFQKQGMTFMDAKREALKKLDRNVHDGIIFRGNDVNSPEYVAFEPTQIKSLNNVGTFDPNDPRVAHAAGPPKAPAPLTPEMTDDNFKKWFGEGTVTDDEGQPLTVYHGTLSGDIDAFRPYSHFGTSEQANIRVEGLTGLDDSNRWPLWPSKAEEQPTLIPAFLNIKNPMRVIDTLDEGDWPKAIARAKALGHDGIVYQNIGEKRKGSDPTHDSWIAFHPTQVKSAIGNRGTFDPNDPRIDYASAAPKPPEPLTLGDTLPDEVDGKPTRDSNGRPIAKTEDEVRNFHKWFRNSKVIDEEGQPMPLYHATPHDISEFIPGGLNPSLSGPAIWLTPNRESYPAAHNVGGYKGNYKEGTNVMPLYVSMKSPLVIDNKGELDWARAAFAGGDDSFPMLMDKTWVEALRDEGYDGIIFKGQDIYPGNDLKNTEYIVFSGTQLKSAISNKGTFDVRNRNVSEAKKPPEPPKSILAGFDKPGLIVPQPNILRTINKGQADQEFFNKGVPTDTLWSPYSKVKSDRPLSEVTADIEQYHQFGERPVVRPEDLNGALMKLVGDRHRTGGLLKSVNDTKLSTPIDLQGGPLYPQLHHERGSPSTWAAGGGAPENINRIASELTDKYGNAYGVYASMAAKSGDFNMMTSFALLNQVDTMPITDASKEKFDNKVREKFPKFAGLADEKKRDELENQLRKSSDLRIHFTQTMDTAEMQKAGFPDVGATRYASAEPEIRDKQERTTGLTISRLDPSLGVIKNPLIPHTTYSTGIPGQFMGGFEVPLLREEVFPTFWKMMLERGTAPERRDRAFQMADVFQETTPEWQDNLSRRIEVKKSRGEGW